MNKVTISCYLDHGPPIVMTEETVYTKNEFVKGVANCVERKKVLHGKNAIIDTSYVRYITIDSFEAV